MRHLRVVAYVGLVIASAAAFPNANAQTAQSAAGMADLPCDSACKRKRALQAAAQTKVNQAQAITSAAGQIVNILQSKQQQDKNKRDAQVAADEQRRLQRRAEEAQRDEDLGEVRRQQQREDANREAQRRKSLADREWEEKERESERERIRNESARGGGGGSTGRPVDGNMSPAYPSRIPEQESWSPWYYLQDEKGNDILDIHIAYWAGGGGLPGERDYPTLWTIRNQTDQRLRIRYQVLVSCLHACNGGWQTFDVIVDPGKTASVPSRQLFSASSARLLSATLAAPKAPK